MLMSIGMYEILIVVIVDDWNELETQTLDNDVLLFEESFWWLEQRWTLLES